MRYLLIFLLLLFFRSNLKAQCDTALIGEWKPITIIWEGQKFDLKNDSVSISREKEIDDTDSFQGDMKSALVQLMFQSFQYIFRKDGSFEITFIEALKDEGTYCFNREKGIIITTTKNSLDQPVSEETKARIMDELLYIKISVDEETLFDIVLKRKK